MSLSSFLRDRRKRHTIKKYVTLLGPMLARRYGKAEHYAPERVRDTIEQNGLPAEEADYALVLYCTPEQFAADQAVHGGVSGYWQLRTEIQGYDFRHGHERGSGGGAWEGSMADYAAQFCSDQTDGPP